jgi:hypothetical protein
MGKTARQVSSRNGARTTAGHNHEGDTVKLIGIRTAFLIFILGTLLRPSTAPATRRTLTDQDSSNDHHERGDVPGWVMITLMSAVLVAALLALAGPALEGLFNQAMDKVGQ